MRGFNLIAAATAALAMVVGVVQEPVTRESGLPDRDPPPDVTQSLLDGRLSALASEVATAPEAPVRSGRTNPFAPLDRGADQGPTAGSTEPPTSGETPGSAEPRVTESSTETVRLNGILYCESHPFAVIGDRIVGVGDEVGGMRVVTIEPGRVVLAASGGLRYVMTPLQPEAQPLRADAARNPTADLPAVSGAGSVAQKDIEAPVTEEPNESNEEEMP